MPDGVTVVGQPLWAAIGYALPALLGTLLAAPRRRQLLFIGDGAFQMTAQELSTILRQGLKPIVFVINNDGYTIERLILGPYSSYNDINQWRYAEAASFFDTRDQAISCTVHTENELEDALVAAEAPGSLVLIEIVMSSDGRTRTLSEFCAEGGRVRLSPALERSAVSCPRNPSFADARRSRGLQKPSAVVGPNKGPAQRDGCGTRGHHAAQSVGL